MKLLFWRCNKSYNEADFYNAIKDMTELNPLAVESLKKCDPRVFCRAYVKANTKCDVIVSNMVETFNSYIIHARSKHLIDMLEEIRTKLMKRLALKKEEASNKWNGLLCPKVQVQLDKEKKGASECIVMPSTTSLFQVTHFVDTLEVDLVNKSCTCKKWNLRGIPCCHAVAAIFYLRKEVENYVESCYTKASYLVAYNECIPPLTGERHWPKVEKPLDPPPVKIGPGRPRKSRIKSPFEDPKRPGKLTRHGLQMSCTLCKSTSHNKRTCPEKDKVLDVQPPLKRSRGRPKNNLKVTTNTSHPSHFDVSAQPTSIGRGGRSIRGGQGSRGRGRRGTFPTKSGGRPRKSSQPTQGLCSTQASCSNHPN